MGETLKGVGVSAGIATGRVLLLESGSESAAVAPIESLGAEDEIARLRRARGEARAELGEIRDRVLGALGEHFAAILEVQLALLDDPALVEETERRIREDAASAATAVEETVGSFVARLESVQKGYSREHGGDLDDVHRRLKRHLKGQPAPRPAQGLGPHVLVAHSLGSAEAVALVRDGVVALVTDLGGPTSHTAILAKALCVPAVVGLHDVSRRVRPGETVVVDGTSGEVELSPDGARLEAAVRRREDWLRAESALAAPIESALTTQDGVPIVLRANIELAEQVSSAMRLGAQGVGLCRSEFLFVTSGRKIPGEEQHYAAYRRIVDAVAPHPAVIRTLDLGGEKRVRDALGVAAEYRGLRAVRFCLSRPDVFLPQLRGLLRAAVHGDVRVLIPMVTAADEILEVRRLLAREAEGLKAAGIACRVDVPVGAMVEVPAAAATADRLVDVCDFLSIGTNDLIQFTLAVDRGSSAAASYYEPLHPAILRMIDFTVQSGRARGRPVALCGEMAANPAFTGLLVGLGIRELSVEPRALRAVAAAVRSVVAERCELVAPELLALGDARAVARRLANIATEGAGEAAR